MSRNITLYIEDILNNMRRAEEFMAGLSSEEFGKDVKSLYAVLRCLEVIGEAAKNVPPDMRAKYRFIPWKDMAGMRDKVIHFYFGVNTEKVWLTVKEDIPRIRPLVEQMLREI